MIERLSGIVAEVRGARFIIRQERVRPKAFSKAPTMCSMVQVGLNYRFGFNLLRTLLKTGTICARPARGAQDHAGQALLFPRRRYRRIYLSLTVLRDQGLSICIIKRASHMDQNLENLIRERAYEIWTSHGCVHGQADQHWLAAEREILTASTATLPGKPGPQKKRPLPARSKITKTLARAG